MFYTKQHIDKLCTVPRVVAERLETGVNHFHDKFVDRDIVERHV